MIENNVDGIYMVNMNLKEYLVYIIIRLVTGE